MQSWRCSNCGYTLEAEIPPEECPSCKEKCEFIDNTCYIPDCEFQVSKVSKKGGDNG